MPSVSTKRRIFDEALDLFSKKGYAAVTVAEIAEAVGIKAPSLYKHFKSKKAIFKAILEEMHERYEKQMSTFEISGVEAFSDATQFMTIDEKQLIVLAKSLFNYFLHDDYAAKFRRMLTFEKQKNPELAALFVKMNINDPLSYQEMIFAMFVQAGFMSPKNPRIMALHFYGPIFLLLTLVESSPQRESEALQLLEEHIVQFNKLYKKAGS